MRTVGGRYELVQRIGIGGMAEVWRGHDAVLDRPVAVKLIAPALRDQIATELVRAEAQLAARLAHPNVANVHDFGLSAGPGGELPYIVMELVEGETLGRHLAAGPIDWRIAVRVCAEVAAALAAAHAHGVVHRDVKPGNIMLTPAGVKVLDFGIAAAAGQRELAEDGPVMGTPAYVAPERFAGVPATPATDVYALGVLLYHCLAGRLPWPADTETGLVHSHRYLDPTPLPQLPGLAPEVVDLVSRCLDKDPAHRPTSLVAALLLAEAVDARVYVPMADLATERVRPSSVPPWNEQAASAPTDAVAVERTRDHAPVQRRPGVRVGRHRA
jgi:serine/threonine protein kinase